MSQIFQTLTAAEPLATEGTNGYKMKDSLATKAVKAFFEMCKNAEYGQFLSFANSLFFEHFFQTSANRSQVKILTWNQLSSKLYILNVHINKKPLFDIVSNF